MISNIFFTVPLASYEKMVATIKDRDDNASSLQLVITAATPMYLDYFYYYFSSIVVQRRL